MNDFQRGVEHERRRIAEALDNEVSRQWAAIAHIFRGDNDRYEGWHPETAEKWKRKCVDDAKTVKWFVNDVIRYIVRGGKNDASGE